MNNLKEYVKKDKYVGVMRCDFASGNIANSWIYSENKFNLSEKQIEEINNKCNDIIFNRYSKFDNIVMECTGEGYNHQKNIFEESNNYVFCTRLIPVIDDYSCCVFVYAK